MDPAGRAAIPGLPLSAVAAHARAVAAVAGAVELGQEIVAVHAFTVAMVADRPGVKVLPPT
jgi:2-keto-4-pentenoate hydratase